MKHRMILQMLAAGGFLAITGAPAMFAGDLHRDYRHVARENADIRRDQRRLHEDLEHGRYWQAARERADLRRDYSERNAEVRDIRRDWRWQ
jgi:hypothetical protein